MRTLRTLTFAALAIAALPTFSAAQQGREFKDAWFWGLKTGGLTVADSGGRVSQAPVVGIDWLIARTHGGLYMAASEAFFSHHTLTLQDPATIDSGFRAISIKNLRRFDAALMGFPGEYNRWHPYIGAGFTLGQIASTRAEGFFSTIDQFNFAQQVIQDERVAFSPFFIGGAQYRFSHISAFGQLTLSPTQKTFLLFNGPSWNFGYELGLRYNVGSSISKDD